MTVGQWKEGEKGIESNIDGMFPTRDSGASQKVQSQILPGKCALSKGR